MQTTSKPLAWVGQALLYAAFAAFIGYFSTSPPYRHLAPDQALIKLSFSHHGQRVAECHQRTPAELAKLPPNMRAAEDCPRERSPVRVEIDLDGAPLYRHEATPSGLRSDGASTVYQRFPVQAGEHRLAVRLSDTVREPGFNFVRERTLTLAPSQVLVVDFSAEKGGVIFQ